VRPNLRTRFGSRLREIRLSRELTQEQLAEKISVSLNFLNMIERGLRAPSFGNLELLAKVLKVEVSELFTFPPSPAKRLAAQDKPERWDLWTTTQK
jgi:transcriptional regulator with XRE-family HTH domain